MLNPSNYIEFLDRIRSQRLDFGEAFVEIYSFIDLLLQEVLSEKELSFSTDKARFFFIAEEWRQDNFLINAGSLVFNLHKKVFDQNYTVSEVEKNLALYVFQELYNYFISIIPCALTVSAPLIYEKCIIIEKTTDIVEYVKKEIPNNEFFQNRLDCFLKELKETKTKYGFPLYEVIVTDEFGNAKTIYLWVEKLNPSFHRNFSFIADFFLVGRKVIFFNLSWSPKGYYLQNEKTHFVIEPDFLLDITAVAECFLKNSVIPELFFLKYVQTPEYSASMLKGGFVNHILNSVFSQKDIDINTDLKTIIKSHFFKILDFTDEDFNYLTNDLCDIHLKNLLQVASFYKGKNITLEPSFISKEYGLQGRLDALVEHPNDENIKTIFELKSGKSHHQNIWQNHYAQMMGYNLLLKSVFDDQRKIHSSILYSQARQKPLRNVAPSDEIYAQFLMCRNVIVDNIYKIANHKMDTANTINTLIEKLHSLQSFLPNFLHEDINYYLAIYNKLEEYEKSYFNAMVSFVMKDMIAQKTGYTDGFGTIKNGYSSLWNLSLKEKIKQKIILRYLKFKSLDGRLFSFDYQGDIDLGGFREGDLLLIYPVVMQNNMSTMNHFMSSKELIANPLKVPIFKAVIKKISSTCLGVVFKNELLTKESLAKFDYFFAEKDILESGYSCVLSNMLKFFSIGKNKRDLFFGLREPLFCQLPKVQHDLLFLHSSFDKILQKALTFQDYLLIQGPPGSGKTSKYLISIIKQHLNVNISPIVVLAFTNRAVEEICKKLIENDLNFLLLGTTHVDKKHHISSLVNNDSDVSIKDNFIEIKKKIAETRIFISTVTNFQYEGNYLRKYIKTDLLIIDEASQLLEIQLIGIVAYFKRFILIGDHFQLPAVATQDVINLPHNLTEIVGINSLQESLFERLHRRCEKNGWREAFDLLSKHYRMHKDIADLVNPFYDNQLSPVNERQKEPFCKLNTQNDEINKPESSFELIERYVCSERTLFIQTSEKKHLRFNIEEANKIEEIIKIIYNKLQDRFTDSSIGVICAWKLQVNLIKSMISSLPFYDMITIDTVERFQGSERDIIIYSTAISSSKLMKNLQSLTMDGKVDRKLNVAISRAKEQFILLGNKEILSESPHYKRVIIACQSI